MKKYYTCFIALSVWLCSCSDEKQATDKGTTGAPAKGVDKQLNISILWDLSDRINPAIHKAIPGHAERDIAIIEYCADYFKQDMIGKGAFGSKGRMKVFFSPSPADEDINTLASKLSVDLSAKEVKEKKQIYDRMTADFGQTARQITETSIKASSWPGADIYRFFKNDVDRCVEQDTAYRNILIILTDGYVYEKSSKGREGNRTEYILPELLRTLGLRNNSNYQSVFKEKNCGLIAKRDDLENLEILVLEINADEDHKDDEDIIKLYLEQWFTEMKVRRFKVYNTDLPENIRKRVADFLNNGH